MMTIVMLFFRIMSVVAILLLAEPALANTGSVLLLDLEPYRCDGLIHTGGYVFGNIGVVTLDYVFLLIQVPTGYPQFIGGVNLYRIPDGSFIAYFAPDSRQQEKQATRITINPMVGEALSFQWWCLAPFGLPINVVLWVEYHTP